MGEKVLKERRGVRDQGIGNFRTKSSDFGLKVTVRLGEFGLLDGGLGQVFLRLGLLSLHDFLTTAQLRTQGIGNFSGLGECLVGGGELTFMTVDLSEPRVLLLRPMFENGVIELVLEGRAQRRQLTEKFGLPESLLVPQSLQVKLSLGLGLVQTSLRLGEVLKLVR